MVSAAGLALIGWKLSDELPPDNQLITFHIDLTGEFITGRYDEENECIVGTESFTMWKIVTALVPLPC